MTKLRLAILGYGRSGGSLHAGPAVDSGQFELAAACDINADNLRQARERFGCRTYEDYHKMLANEQLDLVSVATRSDQHCPMSCDCLQADANVLVTKPWCLNQPEADRLLAAAEKSGKRLLPWLPARWGADFKRIRELIAAGTIGRVFLVRRVQASFATRDDWQTQRRFGGGYLLNWGPHLVDTALLAALSQSKGGKAASVYGRLMQVINPGDVEDIFYAALTTADGTLVTVEYTVCPPGLPNWVVQGTRGCITATGNSVTIQSGPPARPADPTNYADMAGAPLHVTGETVTGDSFGDPADIYRAAAAALRGQAEFPVSPQGAYELTRVLDAIRLSDQENRVVML